MQYRRAHAPGGTFFFTVTLQDRRSDLLVRHIAALREALRIARQRYPFEILAMVVMPDHLHAVWRLPEDDGDFAIRWALFKSTFSRAIPKTEPLGASRQRKRERGIWQRRYWEHQIRDELDLQRHIDYIHINPVKHGFVVQACDWPYSSIHRAISAGELAADWGGVAEVADGAYGEPAGIQNE